MMIVFSVLRKLRGTLLWSIRFAVSFFWNIILFGNKSKTTCSKQRVASSYDVTSNRTDNDSSSAEDYNPFVPRRKIKGNHRPCGFLGWRPECLQPLANIYVFSALVGISYFFSQMATMSLGAQLVSIERQFNIDSSKSGLFNSAAHVGHMTTVLLVGHFARSINIPRAIGCAGILSGMFIVAPSILELTQPYQLPKFESVYTSNQDGYNSQYLCKTKPNTTSDKSASLDRAVRENIEKIEASKLLAYYVLIASMFCQGVVNSFRYGALPFVYIDDNVLDKTRTGVYLGEDSQMLTTYVTRKTRIRAI